MTPPAPQADVWKSIRQWLIAASLMAALVAGWLSWQGFARIDPPYSFTNGPVQSLRMSQVDYSYLIFSPPRRNIYLCPSHPPERKTDDASLAPPAKGE